MSVRPGSALGDVPSPATSLALGTTPVVQAYLGDALVYTAAARPGGFRETAPGLYAISLDEPNVYLSQVSSGVFALSDVPTPSLKVVETAPGVFAAQLS